jgi:Zn-dependent protease with chaperone function
MAYRTTAYRYPNEQFILSATFILVFLVITLTATATFCAGGIFVFIVIGIAYMTSQSHHAQLIHEAHPVSPQEDPALTDIINKVSQQLQTGAVNVFVLPSRELNAYTFGFSDPKDIVLYAALFKIMDRDEMSFIIGHETGHIALGHTWLNSLIGGMAGIPSPSWASAILLLAFRSWNRACEYSADRAGLLACGSLKSAISALVKLTAGEAALTSAGFQHALQMIDAEDDTFLGAMSDALSTHPLIIKRIEQLRQYAQTPEYIRLQTEVNKNVK